MAEKERANHYIGPVVFIYHSPSAKKQFMVEQYPELWKKAEEKEAAHLKKLELLLRFAKIHGLPICWELYFGTDKKKLQELLDRAGVDRKEVHFVEGDISTYSQTFHRLVSSEFRKKNIVSTKVLIAGSFKERCSTNVFDTLKRVFPNAELVFLKGDYNLSVRSYLCGDRQQQFFKYEREGFKKSRKVADVATKSFSRKLLHGI